MELDLPNLDSSLFKINLPTGNPVLGSILVAEPFLREDYFNHGVISLIEYEQGKSAMGLVLNKTTGYTLGDAIEGILDEVDVPIYCGGPLSCDRLFYLHSLGNEFNGATRIADDLYVGGDFQQVKEYVNMGCETEGKMRFFVGYSGWEPNQLEEEIAKHVWAVAPKPANRELFREDGDSFWYRIVRLLGEPYRNWLYHPVNPQYN
jgi:putative transcriptional regulator